MRFNNIWVSLVVVGALAGLGVQACGSNSGSCGESRSCAPLGEAGDPGEAGSGAAVGSAGAAAEAGAAGSSDVPEAGAAGASGGVPPCSTDAACDDGLRCNGAETCVAGACLPGSAPNCDNASSCVESATLALCSYPDPSAWLAYAADEDTPGLYELYVVKQSLIGKQAPIKVNAGLPDGVAQGLLPFSLQWSPDRTWLLFQSANDEQQTITRTFAVNFGSGRPAAPIEISKDLPLGHLYPTFSPSGHDVLAQLDHEAYWIRLTADAPPSPVQVNPSERQVISALWTQGGTRILYTTADGFVAVADVGEHGLSPSAPLGSFGQPVDAYWASADGKWVIFLGQTDRQTFVARAAGGELPRAIGTTDFTGFEFSPDAHYLAYSATDAGGSSSSLYLMDLQNAALPQTMLDHGQALSAGNALGAWAKDSLTLLYYEDGINPAPEEKTPVLYSLNTGAKTVSPYVVGFRDYPIGVSPKGLFMMRYQRLPNEPMELLAMTTMGGAYTLDQNSAGRPYQGVEFNRDGSEAIMCTGANDDLDMFFMDLRGVSNYPRPIRVPGEGPAANCYADFAPDGKGFAFYRFAPDGSRVLNWVDSSKQVLGTPVPITRTGRVRDYLWQK